MTLFFILVFEIVFLLFGIPRFLAEITLLRYCNRMNAVYGWTAALFTVWGFSALLKYPDVLSKAEKTIYPILFGLVYIPLLDDHVWNFFYQFEIHRFPDTGLLLVIVTLAALSLLLLLAEFRREKLFSATLFLIMLFSGATVNPLERGTGAIYNHPLSETVSAIAAREPDARWLCLDCSVLQSNYLMANGARVLSATNFYPDFEKWIIVDPTAQYEDVYNRYANQKATLVEGETSVELVFPDYLNMNLNPETIKELKIDYLLLWKDYDNLLKEHGIETEYIPGQDAYYIYRLSY